MIMSECYITGIRSRHSRPFYAADAAARFLDSGSKSAFMNTGTIKHSP